MIPRDEPLESSTIDNDGVITAQIPAESNVVKFVPKQPFKKRPKDEKDIHTFRNGKEFDTKHLPKEMKKWREEAKHKFVEHLVDEAFEGLDIQLIENYNFPLGDDEVYDRDKHVVLHALRAVFYRQFGIEHSLHGYMDGGKRQVDEETGEETWVFGLTEDEEIK